MEYYVKNEDEKLPPVGRFKLWTENYFFLADVFLESFLLLISGIGLWFVERHSLEFALVALYRGYGTRDRGAGNHRRLHYPRLHEHGGWCAAALPL